MKRIIYHLFTIVTLLGLSACDADFLDRTPYDSVSSENMWETENLTEMGVAGVYNVLRNGLSHDTNVSDKEMYMLERYSMSGQQRPDDALTTGTVNPGHGFFSSTWQDFFEGIHRANDAITNIPLKSPCAEDKKGRLVAECKFLRAYYYFRLNQVFKGVPVYLEPVTPEECTKGQSTEAEVWQVVVDDLTACINEPNLPLKYNAGSSEYGHITKGAAYALRGKAYLYWAYADASAASSYYAKAAADFAQVSTCGYALFQGGYKQLFTLPNEQCEEMIFSQQNIAIAGYGGKSQFVCGPRSSYGWNWNRLMVNPNIVDLYYNQDGSKFNWDDVIPGFNDLAVAQREVYFLRDTLGNYAKYIALGATPAAAQAAANAVKTAVTNKLNSFFVPTRAFYLHSGNEARIKQVYENRDPRLKYNVITPYSDFRGTVNNTTIPQDQVYRWPIHSGNTTLVNDIITNSVTEANYLHRKFVCEGDQNIADRLASANDIPYIRYADVLLMWAEALIGTGDMDLAIEKINMVKQRAGAALLQKSDATKATYVNSIATLTEKLRDERRMEFVNEGINFFDEMRWKTWKETVFTNGKGAKNFWGNVIKVYTWKGDFLYTWPAPTVEVQRNPNIKPTEGWLY